MLKRFDHIIKNALESYVAPYTPDWDVFYDLLVIEQEVPLADDAGAEEDFGTLLAGMEYTGPPSAWSSFEGRLDDLNMELDQEFDQTVGDTLEHIPEATWGVGHWDRMSSQLDDVNLEFDQTIGDALEHIPVAGLGDGHWDLMSSRLDDVNLEFDQTVGDALEHIPEAGLGAGHWNMMSSRLDDLNMDLDLEFDQTVGDALVNLPESTWKERHWQMLSSRLDELNDRPRLIMIKIIEAAAILLLLIQLTNLYSDYQDRQDLDHNLTSYLDQHYNKEENLKQDKGDDVILDPNSMTSSEGKKQEGFADKSLAQDAGNESTTGRDNPHNILQNGGNIVPSNTARQGRTHTTPVHKKLELQKSSVVMELSPGLDNRIAYDYLEKSNGVIDNDREDDSPGVAPQLSNHPRLIDYDDSPGSLTTTSSPRLDVRDISLLTTDASDSILNSIPVFQVITPRIHSSLETGILADATNVVVQDYFALSQEPYKIPTFNGGVYFRYKIQYKDMFGSLGGDYVYMKEGSHNINKLSMVTLPLELGYNVVNLPAVRMYFSGGIAGRFVPVANYSTDETYNQSSEYNSKSNKLSNGLLHNGPFEINSYLSGRLSMGLDINLNKKTSINLRFSHDIWLKGRGIGYDLDKFNSNHLAIGTNFHL